METNDSPQTPPHTLRYQLDPDRAGFFQLVDENGKVWAREIPSEAAALVFAGSPSLLQGYDGLLEETHACFRLRWCLEDHDPDFHEFVWDEGELEERFPGAPEYAGWLHDLCVLSETLRLPDGPQADLFRPSEP